jgi:hypothetical protein
MNQEQLHLAADLESNLTVLDHLLHGLEHSTSDDVELSVSEPDDGELIGSGDDVVIARVELIAWLRSRRDVYAKQLQGLGVEL